MQDGSDADWKAAWKRLATPAPGACPPPEAIAAFVAGAREEDLLSHLSLCASCREDVIAARSGSGAAAPASLRHRLYHPVPRRGSVVPKLAVAAAILVALGIAAVLFWPGEQSPPPIARPKPAPVPKVEKVPTPVPTPEPPPPAPEPPKPVPKPEAAPTPEPVRTPAAPPAPTPEPVPPPKPPVAPPPAPEKPAPEPTRVALKGSLFGIAGSLASQVEGEAVQTLRPGQKRDFAGTLKLKADVAASKASIGPATYYLQRGGELSVLLEEGRTKVHLAKGEAFFDVTPGKGSFIVETALGTVTVKGTRFLVSETEVVVQKGAVDFNAVAVVAGERSVAGANRAASAPQKADLAKRLAWLKPLEDSIVIEADQMALQGGMTVLADPTAQGGRAIGLKTPPRPGQDAAAEIAAKRKQPVPYAVWIRLHWAHGVPSAATLSVGETFTWSSKGVVMNPNWQWVRAGTTELPDERFRVRLTDTQPGLRIDQILITSDLEWSPENK